MVTKIVGILNVTPDSFSDGGKFLTLEKILQHLQKMLDDGASIIDIGGESTRPNAQILSYQQEWQRLEKLLPAIINFIDNYNKINNKEILISIDSYHFENIAKAAVMGIKIINDISGLVDIRIVELIAKKKLTVILMHNLAIHANPDLIINPNLNINKEIIKWAREKIIFLEKNGIKKSQIIFDPGIGFSKNSNQSINILKNIDSYRVLEVPIYIGHSKKSFLDAINIEGDRAKKTIAITEYLAKKGVEYIRVHDVKENYDAITIL